MKHIVKQLIVLSLLLGATFSYAQNKRSLNIKGGRK